jgi:cytochrome c2
MNKRIIILSTVAAISLLIVFNLISKDNIGNPTTIVDFELSSDDLNIGKQLLESKCNTCHSIKASHDAMLAPPFNHIQSKYKKVYKTKEKFIAAVSSFTEEPSKDKALMFGALKQFSVMPKLAYSKEDIKRISEYIYSGKFEQPQWCKP